MKTPKNARPPGTAKGWRPADQCRRLSRSRGCAGDLDGLKGVLIVAETTPVTTYRTATTRKTVRVPEPASSSAAPAGPSTVPTPLRKLQAAPEGSRRCGWRTSSGTSAWRLGRAQPDTAEPTAWTPTMTARPDPAETTAAIAIATTAQPAQTNATRRGRWTR